MKWFTKHWASIGGLMAIAIILYILISDLKFTDIKTLLWLHFVTLLIYQFEEYIYPGGFKEFFQENIYDKKGIMRFPLNDKGIILVNVVLGWTAYLVSAINGEEQFWLAYGLLGVTIINGFMHTLMFVLKRKYNPGFATGLFIMIPFGCYVLAILNGSSNSLDIATGISIIVFAVAFVPLAIYAANKF